MWGRRSIVEAPYIKSPCAFVILHAVDFHSVLILVLVPRCATRRPPAVLGLTGPWLGPLAV